MALVTLLGAELAFGDLPLLDGAALSIDGGDRVGLIGRNGTGKSSLLAVIAGRLPLDDGEVRVRDGARVASVEQEPELPAAPTLRESLMRRGGIDAIADDRERWRIEARLAEYLHRFGCDGHQAPALASGGERKRGALALAFALAPDLLLLDEPTNHLDLDGIAALEELLVKGPEAAARALVVVTHDRAFLDRVALRIVELDRGWLRSWPGNYSAFERRRAAELAAEAVARRRFDRFWAQEEAWIRKGVEARRTRNEGRVQRLERLRAERAARRERSAAIRLALDAGDRSGRLVVELDRVTKAYDGRVLVRELSTRILRGDRVGLIGPNGAGKSTLLKLMLGTVAPDAGRVRLGSNLRVAYFDQLRETLDPQRSVADTISPGSDWIEIGDTRKHVLSYLGDFLFAPRRAGAQVGSLSGGERNRLLLARLFAQPANLLVLDEPTNDLDIESLELLEEALAGYAGTLLLVSHDRAFLDHVVTQTIAAEGSGLWREVPGGYSDWLAQRARHAGPPPPAPPPERPQARAPEPGARPRLSYREQRELGALPAEIEALEREQQALAARMAEPGYHRLGGDAIRADHARAGQIEALLEARYARWAELEDRARGVR
jgi:ATP-binding cassette subfamily F protein uup